MRTFRIASVLFVLGALLCVPATGSATVTEQFTTAGQYGFTVPPGITSIHVHAVGAAGSPGGQSAQQLTAGGRGADVVADLAVSPGAALSVFVGGTGTCATNRPAVSGGFNGGGIVWACGAADGSVGGGGGGASDVRTIASDLSSRVVVAGGGGGGGSGADGGAGGQPGGAVRTCTPAGAGGQTSGGAAGGFPGCDLDGAARPLAGGFLTGGVSGASVNHDRIGGGGGGGWYGGGGGSGGFFAAPGFGGGGGGGSSHLGAAATNGVITTATSDAGRVEISYPGQRLTVSIPGTGVSTGPSGYVDAAVSAGIDCGIKTSPPRTTCSAIEPTGSTITLTAHPDPYTTFTGFTGGGCSGSGLTCTLSMTADRAVTATFARTKATNTVALSTSGTGSGLITGDAGFDCGSAGPDVCTLELLPSVLATLITATPADNSVFAGWISQDCAMPAESDCLMPISDNRTHFATAVFNLKQRTLHVVAGGNGTVTGTGIDCGGGAAHTDCDATVPDGTAVKLTATPAANADLASLSGGGCANASPCTVTLTGDTTVTATFTPKPRTLSVVPIGPGTATVSGPGIDCGGGPPHTDCSEVVPDGTAVTLTVTVAPNSELAGMVGGGCAASPCTVTMTADTTVVALVSLKQRTLTIARDGSGGGAVAGTGIDCGAGCTTTVAYGTSVVLTATPDAGSDFTGFAGGGCTTSPCTVTLTDDVTVTANVAARPADAAPPATGDDGGGAFTAPVAPVAPVAPAGVVVKPSNHFTLSRARANKTSKAIALTLRLPGPGTLKVAASATVAGKTVRYPGATATIRASGTRTLTLTPSKKTKATLTHAQRPPKAKITITYTPRGGTAATQTKSITL
ncbi:MAG TPA: glycine-rich protein [Baekduia sp.]